jgi:hypothetical protein
MNKYTLSHVLNLTIRDNNQRHSRIKELKEYILLKALEFHLMNEDLSEHQIAEIEELLTKNSSETYPTIFDMKYPEVSKYYDDLEIRMIGSLLIEDLKQLNIQNEINGVEELIFSVKNFLEQNGGAIYSNEEKDFFNTLFEKYNMIKGNNGARG